MGKRQYISASSLFFCMTTYQIVVCRHCQMEKKLYMSKSIPTKLVKVNKCMLHVVGLSVLIVVVEKSPLPKRVPCQKNCLPRLLTWKLQILISRLSLMTPTLFSVLPICRIGIKSRDPLQPLKFQAMKMTLPHPLLMHLL